MKEYEEYLTDLLGFDKMNHPTTEDIADYFLEMAQSSDEEKLKETAEALGIDPEEFKQKLEAIRKVYGDDYIPPEEEYEEEADDGEISRLKEILDGIDIPADKIDDHLYYGRLINGLVGKLIREKYENGEAWDEKYDRDISASAEEVLDYMTTPDELMDGMSSMDPDERDQIARSAALGKEILINLREAAAEKIMEYQDKYLEQNAKDLLAGKYKSMEDMEKRMPLYRKENPDGSAQMLNVPPEIMAWGMFIATINEGYLPAIDN